MSALWVLLAFLTPDPVIAPPPIIPAVRAAPPVSEGVKDLFMVRFPAPKIMRGTHCELDDRSVAAAMRRQVSQLKRCYENQLKSRQIVGRLRIVLSIDTQGRVTDTAITEDELEDTGLTRCIRQQMHRFSWPATNEPYTLAWPILFQPAP